MEQTYESDAIINAKCREVVERLNATMASLYTYEAGSLVLRAGFNIPEQAVGNIVIDPRHSLTGRVAETGEGMVVTVNNDSRWSPRYTNALLTEALETPRHLVVASLKDSERVIGTLSVLRSAPEFTNDDLRLLEGWCEKNTNLLAAVSPYYSRVEPLLVDPSADDSSVITISSRQWDEVIRSLALKPESLHDLTPRKFEELIAELLVRQGLSVTLTGQTRDGGRDILAYNRSSFGDHLFLVECKKHAPQNPVGVSLIRHLYGVVEADRATAGILCTTSRFTADATKFADNLRHRLTLHEYDDLVRWLYSSNEEE